jgi:hypothetical protein
MKIVICFSFVCLCYVGYSKPHKLNPILTQQQGNILVDYYVTNQVDLWYSYCKNNNLSIKRCLRLCRNYYINPTYNTFGKSKDKICGDYHNWYYGKEGQKFRAILLKDGIRCSIKKDKDGYPYLDMR